MASGDFASDILNRGQNAVGGWSRMFGGALFNEFRFGYNSVRSDSIHPAFGIDANAQYGISGVPKDPRFYGGLPHMPIARFARHRRPVLPAAVPDLAGVPVRRQPDLEARAATR